MKLLPDKFYMSRAEWVMLILVDVTLILIAVANLMIVMPFAQEHGITLIVYLSIVGAVAPVILLIYVTHHMFTRSIFNRRETH